MKKKILHSFYAGLGGHTAVFFAALKYSQAAFFTEVAMYGIEDPLESTKSQLDKRNIPTVFLKKKSKWDLLHPIKYAWQIRRRRADLIFLHGGYAIVYVCLFCVIFGKSKLLIRETQALNLKTFRQRINSLVSIFVAHRIVFLSNTYRDEFFNTTFKRSFLQKSQVIPNGLDLDLFSPIKSPVKDGIIKVGMFSRIVPIKDYRTLIKSFEQVIKAGFLNCRLVIAGDGADLKNIIQYANDLNIERYCEFKGLLNKNELISYLQDLDIYVHSSLGETMSNSIMQAQACGLPIIATDVFGINNVIVSGENGFLFGLGDTEELTILLQDLIKSPTKRMEYGKISREYAENCLSDQIMGKRYNELFCIILNETL